MGNLLLTVCSYGLLFSYVAAPFVLGYGMVFPLSQTGRLAVAAYALVWMVPVFSLLREESLFGRKIGDFMLKRNGILLALSVLLQNIPYLVFRIFYGVEALLYLLIVIKYLRLSREKYGKVPGPKTKNHKKHPRRRT